MSDEELKIEEYRQLLQQMHSLCEEMPEIIFTRYFDENKYLYSLYNLLLMLYYVLLVGFYFVLDWVP